MTVRQVLQRSPLLLALAGVAAVAMVLTSEGLFQRSAAQLDALTQGRAARETIQALERSILAAESGQRGYLLTARQADLAPYQQALQDINTALRTLDHYYAGAPAPQAVLARLHSATEAKLAELALTIRMQDTQRGAAGIELMQSGIGRELMETIRQVSAELLAGETSRVAAGRGDLDRTLLGGRVGVAALSLLSLLALFLFLRQATLQQRHQQELRRVTLVERDGLDVQVRQRTAQLTELTQHLQTAREDERNRLARDLHDELGALLTSAKLDAARIKSRLSALQPPAPEALDRLAHLVGTLNSSIALGRRIIEDLRPSTLADLGLQATLEILAREFAERAGVQVHCALVAVRLAPATELVIYRLVQEAVTNISKYARATQVWLSLTEQTGWVALVVRDDGVGFDTRSQRSSAYGLVGMRFRVEAEGGTLAVLSGPGLGTELQVRLPLAPEVVVDGSTVPSALPHTAMLAGQQAIGAR